MSAGCSVWGSKVSERECWVFSPGSKVSERECWVFSPGSKVSERECWFSLGSGSHAGVASVQKQNMKSGLGEDSVFYKLGDGGIISFSDYIFLLVLLSSELIVITAASLVSYISSLSSN